jgi:2-polyprenyl-3-methyl-5-hydroxy-6-metoxy-1,4-benzoquinol methylase
MDPLSANSVAAAQLAWLSKLAEAATIHAVEQHCSPSPLTIHRVDLILDAERAQGLHDQRSALVTCYGAWLGAWLVDAAAGQWCGLHEPVPPRVQVGSLLYSPLDAVERRLSSAAASTLQSLVQQAMQTYQAEQAASPLSSPHNLVQVNQEAWDKLSEDVRFVAHSFPATAEQAEEALDPWIRSEQVRGKKVICLAAGGGTHAPLLARAGAHVTVVDISPKMLDVDRRVAQELQLDIELHTGSAEDLSQLAAGQFDLAVQPVSMSYIKDPEQVYRQLARVLRPNALYVAQHKSPGWLQSSGDMQNKRYWLNSRPGTVIEPPCTAVPNATSSLSQFETGTIEIIHGLDALLGGLCRAGFVIEDFCEPPRGDAWSEFGQPAHQALLTPPYIKVKARFYGGL